MHGAGVVEGERAKRRGGDSWRVGRDGPTKGTRRAEGGSVVGWCWMVSNARQLGMRRRRRVVVRQ